MARIKLGVLGASNIGRMVVPALKKAGFDVAAIAARSPARARKYAKKYGMPLVHRNYSALLRDPEISAIYNPLANHVHYSTVKEALQRGKHVLVEKPALLTMREFGDCAKLARRKKRILMEAYWHQYHPYHQKIKKMLRNSVLGKLRHIDYHFSIFPPRVFFRRNYRMTMKEGGGALWDLGFYGAGFLNFIGGEWKVLDHHERRQKGIDLETHTLLRNSQNVTTVLYTGFLGWGNQITLYCEEGHIQINPAVGPDIRVTLTMRSEKVVRKIHHPADSYLLMSKAFLSHVRSNRASERNELLTGMKERLSLLLRIKKAAKTRNYG